MWSRFVVQAVEQIVNWSREEDGSLNSFCCVAVPGRVEDFEHSKATKLVFGSLQFEAGFGSGPPQHGHPTRYHLAVVAVVAIVVAGVVAVALLLVAGGKARGVLAFVVAEHATVSIYPQSADDIHRVETDGVCGTSPFGVLLVVPPSSSPVFSTRELSKQLPSSSGPLG